MDDLQKLVRMEVAERYIIRGILGTGGSAVVVRATDAVRAGDVALKLYGTEDIDLQTAEAACQFRLQDSSAVLPLWDVHTALLDGPATSMPIMASTLHDTDGVLASTAVHIARRLLTALEFCHGRGVPHGDIKPGNVFIDDDGNYLLGDFGAVDYTAEYASPERVGGAGKSAGDDLWATAVLLYELLVGEMPFGCQPELTEEQIGARIAGADYREPGRLRPYLPFKFKRFFEHAFAQSPTNRFRSAAEMRSALRDLSIYVEWHSVHQPPAITYEGQEIAGDGRFTGVRQGSGRPEATGVGPSANRKRAPRLGATSHALDTPGMRGRALVSVDGPDAR